MSKKEAIQIILIGIMLWIGGAILSYYLFFIADYFAFFGMAISFSGLGSICMGMVYIGKH